MVEVEPEFVELEPEMVEVKPEMVDVELEMVEVKPEIVVKVEDRDEFHIDNGIPENSENLENDKNIKDTPYWNRFRPNPNWLKNSRYNCPITGFTRYKCDFCDRTFSQSGSLTKHRQQHTKEMQFKCDKCNYECNTATAMLKHERKHARLNKGKGSTIKCNDYKCPTTRSNYKCDECDFVTKYPTAFKNHKRVHVFSEKTPLTCDQCSYSTFSAAFLKKHKQKHLVNVKAEKEQHSNLTRDQSVQSAVAMT